VELLVAFTSDEDPLHNVPGNLRVALEEIGNDSKVTQLHVLKDKRIFAFLLASYHHSYALELLSLFAFGQSGDAFTDNGSTLLLDWFLELQFDGIMATSLKPRRNTRRTFVTALIIALRGN